MKRRTHLSPCWSAEVWCLLCHDVCSLSPSIGVSETLNQTSGCVGDLLHTDFLTFFHIYSGMTHFHPWTVRKLYEVAIRPDTYSRMSRFFPSTTAAPYWQDTPASGNYRMVGRECLRKEQDTGTGSWHYWAAVWFYWLNVIHFFNQKSKFWLIHERSNPELGFKMSTLLICFFVFK